MALFLLLLHAEHGLLALPSKGTKKPFLYLRRRHGKIHLAGNSVGRLPGSGLEDIKLFFY
jgi:hypothetical protein